jgi:hypothetical protein
MDMKSVASVSLPVRGIATTLFTQQSTRTESFKAKCGVQWMWLIVYYGVSKAPAGSGNSLKAPNTPTTIYVQVLNRCFADDR